MEWRDLVWILIRKGGLGEGGEEKREGGRGGRRKA